MSAAEAELIEVARVYCHIIETSDREDRQWLRDVAALLPRLHAAVAAVKDGQGRDSPCARVDLDARFDLFSRLRNLLGERDSYWMEYDTAGDGPAKTGSLADDLTDIYCELKLGLRLMDRAPEDGIEELRRSFEVHWGQHLLDAERHLYSLNTQGQLP